MEDTGSSDDTRPGIFFLGGFDSSDGSEGEAQLNSASQITWCSEELGSVDGASELSLCRVLTDPVNEDGASLCLTKSCDKEFVCLDAGTNRADSPLGTHGVDAGLMQCLIKEQACIEHELEMFVQHQRTQLQSFQSVVKASLFRQRNSVQRALLELFASTPRGFEQTGSISSWQSRQSNSALSQETCNIGRTRTQATSTTAFRSIFDGLTNSRREPPRSYASKERRTQSLRQRAQNIVLAYRSTMHFTEQDLETSMSRRLTSAWCTFRDIVKKWRLLRFEWLARWVQTNTFHFVVCVVIALNSLYIGFSIDLSVQSALEGHDAGRQDLKVESSPWMMGVDVVFNAFFVLELLVRFLAYQGEFFVGEEWRWNVFDVAVVSFSVGNLLLLKAGLEPGYARVIRLARVGRALSVVRMARFSRFFSKIRLLLLAVAHCGMMLLWAVVFLTTMLFFFAVIFMHAVSTHLNDSGGPTVEADIERLRLYFGSLPMTMLTLFMSVSGGVDWWDVVDTLLSISVLYVVLFLVFVIVTVLAIMNVISAIFVNDAMETASMDMDLRMKAEVERTRVMVGTLTSIFKDMSIRGEWVAPTEFANQMEREDMKLFCASIGLYFTNYNSLFKLLDVDDNGVLSIDEFVIGFLRLRGGSVMIDMEVTLQETKSLIRAAITESRSTLEELSEHVQTLRNQFAIS